jgi:hypothetical protein
MGFEADVKKRFGALDTLEWVDENVMITAEKAW